MRFSAYSDYKPSGVEWLGNVPAHWEVKRLRYMCRFAYGDSLASENREDGEIPVYGSNGPVGSHIIPNTLGPVVIVGRKGSHGKVNLSQQAVFAIDTTYFIDQRHTLNDIPWLFYMLMSLGLDAVSKDSAVPGLSREDAYGYFIATPPLSEQRAIAAFLDAKTEKLDTLIAKKRELIEKLKEKRAALISHTVTGGLPPEAARAAGLNPRPNLKPSGVEWLGNIPEHWKTKQIKFIAHVGNGSTPNRENTDYWEDGIYPWLNSSVVNQSQVIEACDFVTDLALRECHLPRIKPPVVLVGITGQGKTRGMATILQIEATINQHLAYLKPFPSEYDVGYLGRVLDRAYPYLRNESEGGGSTKGAITCEQLGNIKVPCPPILEQHAIAKYLDRETAKIDQMIGKVETAIEKLQEYRTALITAVVTGKVDVREAAA